MRRTFSARYPVLAAAGAFVALPLVLDAQKLTGQWDVQYERGSTMTHGSATGPQDGSARMTLRHQGDSVFGQWQAIVASGEPPAPDFRK